MRQPRPRNQPRLFDAPRPLPVVRLPPDVQAQLRQSTPGQVQHNRESQRRQYALGDRARALGWHDIDVIDDDLGMSASGTRRAGFDQLLRAVCTGQVGAVFSIDASRLARTGREWQTLLEFCSVVGVLLIDADTVYDPHVSNDRLLLGMKGTFSEMEAASFYERAEAALRQKARRGELVQRVPIGYVTTLGDRIENDPDARAKSISGLISSRSRYPSRGDPTVRGRSSGSPRDTRPCCGC